MNEVFVRGYLGNQARGQRGGNKGNRPNRGNNGGPRHPRHELPMDDFVDGDDIGIISPEELAASRQSMNLSQLKLKPVGELVEIAARMGIENMARSRKQDIIFEILKNHARGGENIFAAARMILEDFEDDVLFARTRHVLDAHAGRNLDE